MCVCYNTTQSGSKRLKILTDGDEATMPTRDDAYILMTSHVKNENLQKHMFSVEAAMRFYARKYEEEAEIWAMTGLLHDCDYEKFPDLNEHTLVLAQWLREDGYDERIIYAILAHNDLNQATRRGVQLGHGVAPTICHPDVCPVGEDADRIVECVAGRRDDLHNGSGGGVQLSQ